ncbi:MAG: hypothetical protein ACOC6F_01500 [bacterium]
MAIHHENRAGGYRGSSVFKDLVTLQLHLREDEDKTGDDIHYIWATPKKRRQATIQKFSFIWFVEDGDFKAGLLKDEGIPFKDIDDIVAACRTIREMSGEWPGKDALVKARSLHGLSRKGAQTTLEAAQERGLVDVEIGAHNKHKYTVVN